MIAAHLVTQIVSGEKKFGLPVISIIELLLAISIYVFETELILERILDPIMPNNYNFDEIQSATLYVIFFYYGLGF